MKDVDILIVTDCRFPNESQRVHDYGGIAIKVTNPRIPMTDDVADNALDGCDDWDMELVNDGTLDDFYRKIAELPGLLNL
jgi:hypothetical protein